jgi:uncharacterized protein (PEP-CTERM system associated)
MGGFLAALLAQTNASVAFPFVDPTNADSIPTGAPTGTELPATDTQGLQNNLRLTNPAAPGNPSTWTIIPRLTIQEMFSDNALEVTSPRRFDATTNVSPGVNIAADTSRLKLTLDYQPTLMMHAIEGPLNVLTQQLNLTGLVTVVPDLAFVDIRALSGVQSRLGALAGGGTLGTAGNTATATALAPANSNQTEGLNRNNEVQTSSFGLSPYLLRQLGDYGSIKVGASINASRYATISGFMASPLPSGGINGSSLLSTEQIAHYSTGEFMQKFQDSIDVDLMQTKTHNDAVTANTTTVIGGATVVNQPAGSFSSRQETFTNQLSYALSHTITLQGSIGYQQVAYSQNNGPHINGLTWNAGFTYTPSPDSSLTISYGHLNGTDALQANGRFAIGGRSVVTLNYSNTIGTQLENLQNQLNNSAINVNGQLINAITGGPNFVAQNAIGAQNGVFRFSTLTSSFSTQWARDSVQASLSWSIQTNITPGATTTTEFIDPETGNLVILNQPNSGNSQSTDAKTASLSWTHDLSPDMSLGTSVSYTLLRRGSLGTDGSLSTAIGLQYTLSPSTSLSARYSFFDRVSKIPGYSLYENIMLLGVTKQF